MGIQRGGGEKTTFSLIIPVKPPEPNLPALIYDLWTLFPTLEILVQEEPGLGRAIKAGVRRSSQDLIGVMDADGSHSPDFFIQALLVFSRIETDLIIGSRYQEDGSSQDALPRKILSLFCTALTRLFLFLRISDPLSGLVIGKREIFEKAVWGSGYKFGLSLIDYCKRKGLSITEIPYCFHSRIKGQSKANPLIGLKFFKELLLLRLKH